MKCKMQISKLCLADLNKAFGTAPNYTTDGRKVPPSEVANTIPSEKTHKKLIKYKALTIRSTSSYLRYFR